MSGFAWPRGLMTALVTPLADDEIDVAALGRLIDYQVDAGAKGLVIGGGTGEFGSLSLAERAELAEHVVALADGRLTVVVQTGALATRDAVWLSRRAQQAGADALLVISPFGEAINWRERYDYYGQVTASTTLPVMIYNTPPAGLLDLEQLMQLSTLPTVGAVKDSAGDSMFLNDLLAARPEHGLEVYLGSDTMLLEGLLAGVTGCVFGVTSFIPGPIAHLVERSFAGASSQELLPIWGALRPFLRFVEESSNYMSFCKVGCRRIGIDAGAVRSPYLMPDPAEIELFDRHFEHVRAALSEQGLPDRFAVPHAQSSAATSR
ncbi:dihydrodipicolinate synthase family protein [uncultured Amnibacterium sp.]|uniref:dihydrodipicolinate synthase family protein n=1 Tax=uncultured Amnibacterium sp. TaxID=1631851 RepID=UPI0035CB4BB8